MPIVKIAPGQRHGQLLVICRVPNNKFGQSKWLCACDCGREKEIIGFSLTQGVSKSCGCLRGKALAEYRKTHQHPKLLPGGVAATNRLWHSYQTTAKRMGRGFELSRAEFERLIEAPCHYCGIVPSRQQRPNSSKNKQDIGGVRLVNGIDRIDNTAGYVSDNCVSCCRTCNMAKRSMTYSEFLTWVFRAAAHLSRSIPEQQAIAVQ